MDSNKNAGNVAGGLKATLKNPRVSEEAKQSARERLHALQQGASIEEVQSGSGDPSYDAAAYKAQLGGRAGQAEAQNSDTFREHVEGLYEDIGQQGEKTDTKGNLGEL